MFRVNGKDWWPTLALTALTMTTRVGLYLGLSRYRPGYWSYQEVQHWDGWGRIALFMAQGYGLADTHLITYFPREGPPVPTAARPPLPVMLFAPTLRLFGESLLPVVIVQAGIDAVTAVVVYHLTRRLVRSGVLGDLPGAARSGRLTALLAASGFVLFVPAWVYTVGFMSEPLFTLLLTSAVGLLIVSRTGGALVTAGILFGLAGLSRPSIVFFPFLLVPWLIWRQGVPIRLVLLLPLAMGATLGPWVARNYLVFHRVIVTQTLGGYNLYRHSGRIEHDDYLRWVSWDESRASILALIASRGLTPQTITEPELDDLLKGEARRIILAHPWRYVNLTVHRAGWLFYDRNIGQHSWPHLRLVYLGAVLGLFAVIGFGFWRYHGHWIPDMMPLWLLVGYTVVVHAAIVAQFRFLVPLVPLLACPGAYVLTRAWAEWRRSAS